MRTVPLLSSCSLLLLVGVRAAETTSGTAQKPEWSDVQLQGKPTRYMADVERYRFGGAPSVTNAAFYPIPQDHITRADYMRVIEASNPTELARHPNQGLYAPGNFLPVLAKYAQTGEATWGRPIVAMLKEFHAAMQREVAANKWVSEFEFAAADVPLYRDYLLSGGHLKPDDAWFRDLWLYYCRSLNVWNSGPTEWRGGCHRSIPEAVSKGLAAKWYPDIPEAARWEHYSELVLGDFWKYKDLPQNDTGYMLTALTSIVCNGDQWTRDDRLIRNRSRRGRVNSKRACRWSTWTLLPEDRETKGAKDLNALSKDPGMTTDGPIKPLLGQLRLQRSKGSHSAISNGQPQAQARVPACLARAGTGSTRRRCFVES